MRLLLCFLCVTVCSRAGLINPGFETFDFTGWTIGGTSLTFGVGVDGSRIPAVDPPFSPAFVNVHSGNVAAFAVVKCAGGCSPLELIILSQVIAVVPNTTYSIGFFLGNDSASPAGIHIDNNHLQIFVDGAGLLPSDPTQFIAAGSTPADMRLISSFFSSGARTSVTAKFQITASGTSRAGVSFDDFFVTAAVPEPGSAMLIAIGLAILALSRSVTFRRNNHAL
jgi:PEP-CTERM motif-containing protein